ncbi:MAG: hypothetical protein NVS1B2_16380 [Vulcanimicrobiaceae bacterium]
MRPGTTQDVYSINATVAEAAKSLGGGGSQNQEYSAIAAVPGAYVPTGQTGWNQQVYIRGGDYDQTGYEFDGVPVNRAFDNYAAHTGSSLGQQELQVYTGGGPSGASANGLGGFINQVIRTGTYPGFANGSLGFGTPAFYHDLKLQVGGATSNRNFSYYLGFVGSNQAFRPYDQFSGSGQLNFEVPLTVPGIGVNSDINGVAPKCVGGSSPTATAAGTSLVGVSADPGCYAFTTSPLESIPLAISDREIVANLHFGIPTHGGAMKDDIQLLYTNSALDTNFGSSTYDLRDSLFDAYGTTVANYTDGYIYNPSVKFGAPAAGLKPQPYFFPSSPTDRAFGGPINSLNRDGFENDSSIIKLQYQKNFSSNAYARVFGYSFYSDWLNNAPTFSALGVPVNVSRDYELDTHTRGIEAQLADQINDKHLLQATFNYTTASVVRYNNRTMNNTLGTKTTNLIDAAGNCYGSSGNLDVCNGKAYSAKTGLGDGGTFGNPTPFAATGAAATANAQWQVTYLGPRGTLNRVMPKFTSYAIQDQFKPTDKLVLNVGLRDENFQYDLDNTNTPDKNFWFAAARREFCYDPQTLANGPVKLTCPAGFVHPDGVAGTLFSNDTSAVTHNVLEPRVAFTYTVNPDTVVRGSYGRYAQPPNTAAVQYNTAEANTAAYDFGKFVGVGFFSPRHDIRPAISSNFDLSLEHHFKGTDASIKVTPWVRSVLDQQNNVYLDQVTQFVSAINAGNVKAHGLEIQLSKGSFDRDGLAASLSYAYTAETIKYNNLGNGNVNVIDQINNSISGYNAFTAKGGGARCYDTAGKPDPACLASSVANPYFGSDLQPLLDRNGSYTPFDLAPAVFGAVQDAYYAPHTITALLNYKHKRLTVTPSIQMNWGTPYGVPTQVLGIDPSTCGANSLAIPTAVAAGRGQAADYTSCTGTILVPNPESARFDRMGEYQNPTNLLANLNLSYEVSKGVKASLLFANLVNTCFGGTQAVWANGGNHVCSYGLDAYTPISQYSNFYNGSGPNDVAANGAVANPYNAHAYRPNGFTNPLNVYFNLDFKI